MQLYKKAAKLQNTPGKMLEEAQKKDVTVLKQNCYSWVVSHWNNKDEGELLMICFLSWIGEDSFYNILHISTLLWI